MKAKYKEKGSIDNAIIGYFNNCTNSKRIPSKVGLALYLDVDKSWLSRHSDKENKDKFPGHRNAIKRAYGAIEEEWINLLATGKPVGAIFYLKNAFKEDYRDKQEYEHTTPEPIQFKVTIYHAQGTESHESISGDVPSS